MYVVIGKSGQLAKELNYFKNTYELSFLGQKDINLLDLADIEKVIKDLKPKAIINASAYTKVDKAEIESKSAFSLNRDSVKNLAKYSYEHNIRLIHISTDFVFDGEKTPYTTNDQTNPINVYGESKLAGEIEIQKILKSNFSIIRTSWLYSSFGNNFVKTMINLMNEKSEIKVVSDQIGCPTYARGLAQFIFLILSKEHEKTLYHWSDKGSASWFDFAKEIFTQSKGIGLISNDVKIIPIRSSDFQSLAKRPKYSVMQLEQDSNIGWKENLRNMLQVLVDES